MQEGESPPSFFAGKDETSAQDGARRSSRTTFRAFVREHLA